MPQIIVKYKNKRTLEALHDFAKYFDYEISSSDSEVKKGNHSNLNGVTIITADKSVDASGLSKLFTARSLNASKLRNEAWQRRK